MVKSTKLFNLYEVAKHVGSIIKSGILKYLVIFLRNARAKGLSLWL